MIVVATYASTKYLHTIQSWARHVTAAVAHLPNVTWLVVTNRPRTCDLPPNQTIRDLVKPFVPGNHTLEVQEIEFTEHEKGSGHEWSLNVAKLQSPALSRARQLAAKYFFSVESDILIPPNAFDVLLNVLQFDKGYYDIAAGTYCNEAFLCGFGDERATIAEDYHWDERTIPSGLKRELACLLSQDLTLLDTPEKKSQYDAAMKRVLTEVRKCPPVGHIWDIIARNGWRRRGWFEQAYPTIGKGAVVPVDWCGMGCTLLSAKALSLATFTGFSGEGTQDLFLCHQRWGPAGLRIACSPHILCDHIKPDGEKWKVLHAYHEQAPQYAGHLRQRVTPWREDEL